MLHHRQLLLPSKQKKPVKLGEEKEKRAQEDARRQEGEKKKKKSEVEKVKQAQERARARDARTNQLEHQQTLCAAEQQQSVALSAAEECAEKIRGAQGSRRRAKERIRMKLHRKTPETRLLNTTPGMGADPAKVKSFRIKTIKRLHAYLSMYELSERLLWWYSAIQ